jgi:serine/threonine protein kinase
LIEIPGYKVIKPLGKGGMATVYLAMQTSVDREVALKIMAPQLNLDPTFGERFLREARIAAKLHHRHVVSIYDVGVHGDIHYIAMEYLSGGPVMPKELGPLELRQALKCVREIAGALDYAHSKGFIHRDVKPDNILLRDDQSCVLSDFGIARAADSGTAMTKTGSVVGTPHYMSPEQLRGQRIDGRADLYSLGVVFYQLLTGEVPYTASDSLAIGIMHMTAPMPVLPREYGFAQPLLHRMMAKRIEERVQSGSELVRLVQQMELQLKETPMPIPKMMPTKRPVSEPELPSLHADRATHFNADAFLDSGPGARTALGSGSGSGSGSISRVRTEPQIGRIDQMQSQMRAPPRQLAKESERSLMKPLLLLGLLAATGYSAWHFRAPALAFAQREFPSVFGEPEKVPGTLEAPPGSLGPNASTTTQSTSGIGSQNDAVASVDITRPREQDPLEAQMAEEERKRTQQTAAQQRATEQARIEAEQRAQRTAQDQLAAREQQISELLLQAATAVEDDRLPSALQRYRSVLKLDAENARAQAGVKRVANLLLNQAKEAQKAGRNEKAAELLAQAKQAGADAKAVRELAEKLDVDEIRAASSQISAADDLTLQTLVEQGQGALARGQLMEPPGESAYDRLRAAQNIARGDPRVEALELRVSEALIAQLDRALTSANYEQVMSAADGLKIFAARNRNVNSEITRAADALASAARERVVSDPARARELLGYLRTLRSTHPAIGELNAALN